MSGVINTLRKALVQIINDIDAGNTNLEEDEEMEILSTITGIMDKKAKLSKYQACNYLGISRATFDNYVREGKLPKGKKEQGFKELFWNKKELLTAIKKFK